MSALLFNLVHLFLITNGLWQYGNDSNQLFGLGFQLEVISVYMVDKNILL